MVCNMELHIETSQVKKHSGQVYCFVKYAYLYVLRFNCSMWTTSGPNSAKADKRKRSIDSSKRTRRKGVEKALLPFPVAISIAICWGMHPTAAIRSTFSFTLLYPPLLSTVCLGFNT